MARQYLVYYLTVLQFLWHEYNGETLVFVQEMCGSDGDVYTGESFQKYLTETSRELPVNDDVQFLSYDEVCGQDFTSLLLESLWSPKVNALVGSLDNDDCELASRISTFKNKPFLSWTCPVLSRERLVPSLEEVSSALVLALDTYKARTAVIYILHSEVGFWTRQAYNIEMRLVDAGISARRLYLPEPFREKSFNRIKAIKPKVVIVCASFDSSMKILQSFDSHSIYPSMVLILDIFELLSTHSDLASQAGVTVSKYKTEKLNREKKYILFDYLPTAITTAFRPKSSIATLDKMFSRDFVNKNSTRETFASSRGAIPPNIYPIVTTKTFPITINESNNMALNYTEVFEDDVYNNSYVNGGMNLNTNKQMNKVFSKISKGNTVYNYVTQVIRARKSLYENRTESNQPTEMSNRINNDDKMVSTTTRGVDFFTARTMNIKPDKARKQIHNKNKLRDKWLDKDRMKRLDEIIVTKKGNKFVQRYVRENFKYKRRKRVDNINTYNFDSLTAKLRSTLLIMTLNNLEKKSIAATENPIFESIITALNLIYEPNLVNSTFNFQFYDRVFESSDVNLLRIRSITNKWRLVMTMESRLSLDYNSEAHISLNVTRKVGNFDRWLMEKYTESTWFDCEEDSCEGIVLKMNVLSLSGVIGVSLILFTMFVGLAFFIRNEMVKRKKYKRSNKVVLYAGDFVFPQLNPGGRVEEGMEKMLCCWLQQFQEYGGPEIDKPDLVKGSIASLKGLGANMNTGNGTKGHSSNGSIVRSNYIVDTRTRYNGDLVQMKYFPNFGNFELKRKANDVLMVMQGLRHENLNPFIGCLCDPSKPALVFEYCSRGSLEDVLIADEIKLDWTFRLSLLTDLVRGMRYLHTTTLRAHGFLTSRNCVVDARWVLKVTDYGLPTFYRAQSVTPPPKTARDLLWTAPEILRGLDSCGGLALPPATQAGDVYSFAIVMQEVVVRGEPFCMLALSPQEIIEKVKKPPPLIRPSVSKGAAPPEAINIMRQCWTEQPEMRPDFNAVHDLFRKLNQGRKVNFIDTMFQMLEKYSNNLEELIKERTEQLDMEKKKTEQLLVRMLPSYVAEKLKLGMPVDPEEFSEVSIYFSDIVGFTSISAHSSPFQVVDLLNDLYTCFDATINAYNVYKVETIGDAYMVVGGLPVRIPDHAEQIATMALDLLHQAGRFRIRHLPKTPLRLRIGLHTGPCCAGVVGLTMPRYCLFGDTVNTASRMESTGAAWRIHLSQATRDKLEAAGGYIIENRGLTEIKGKGRMHTYWLLGKSGFEKPLPTPPPIELDASLFIEKETLSVSSSLQQRSEDNTSDSSMRSSPKPPGTLSPKVIHSLSAEEKSMPFIDSDRTSDKVNSDRSINVERSPIIYQRPVTKDPEMTAQQIVEIRKMNYAMKHEVSLKQNDVYQRKAEPSADISESFSNGDIKSELAAQSSDHEHLVNEAAKLLLSAKPKEVNRENFKIRRSSNFDDHDLSTPYNHYKLLSPSDSHLNQSSKSCSLSFDRPGTGRLLKRQFSLDKTDDYTHGRLYKQNSAGAANDLEKIEEIPTRRLSRMEPCCSTSVSAESLHHSNIWSGR